MIDKKDDDMLVKLNEDIEKILKERFEELDIEQLLQKEEVEKVVNEVLEEKLDIKIEDLKIKQSNREQEYLDDLKENIQTANEYKLAGMFDMIKNDSIKEELYTTMDNISQENDDILRENIKEGMAERKIVLNDFLKTILNLLKEVIMEKQGKELR